ncbi:CTD kinase subunit gamma [Colletotrichum higginsianum]|uniref:CTD kinase subunit gamma n=1 Tax=Colletotrichum higginsianum TaxID=80884 RepID=A0A4T0W9V8_9PEZI|nr:CTD kinase subunit gamma [Colletotrichum higginsianum]
MKKKEFPGQYLLTIQKPLKDGGNSEDTPVGNLPVATPASAWATHYSSFDSQQEHRPDLINDLSPGIVSELDSYPDASPQSQSPEAEYDGNWDSAEMADPFEVRMRFTAQLQHLNASVTSAQKAAQYALKYKDMDEDLHSCILEQLERNNMNTRANIMYFIEHFLEMAQKEKHIDYVRMMQRDIIRIVDAVAPDDGSGAANVKVVRRVLRGLQQKDFLEARTVDEIEEVLKERETSAHDAGLSSPVNGDVEMGDAPPAQSLPTNGRALRLEKRQIEQRIEEDRERHKRLRENIWAIGAHDNAEVDKIWEETSDFGDDDHILAEEEFTEFTQAMQHSCPPKPPAGPASTRIVNGKKR